MAVRLDRFSGGACAVAGVGWCAVGWRMLVLVAEQGLGDTLQFVRDAPLVQAQGGRVMVECAAAIHPLLAHARSRELDYRR